MQLTEQRRFLIGLAALCALYFIFELFFNTYAMFSVDEFWFAHRIYQYKEGLPYKDFAPYKTVLGYYLLLLPLLVSKNIISGMIVVKNTLALLNAAILLGTGWWLRRYFAPSAILTGLSLLISSEIVLSYSTNIRVDLLGYWFCFFSLLWLLENRFLLAGLFLGLGFITTQKALWYITASNVALISLWLYDYVANTKKPSPLTLKSILIFNLVTASVILAYLIAWAWVVNWQTVFASVFLEASAMYQLDWYDAARELFWGFITLYNPLLFLLWPLTIISLWVTFNNDTAYRQRLFITLYTFTILFCLIPYKQVFPYYMQVTIPVFFILYIAFADWLFLLFKPDSHPQLRAQREWLIAFISLYILCVVATIVLFKLPDIYLLICMIPILLGIYICRHTMLQSLHSLFFNLIVISLIFVGGIYPLTLFATKLINLNGAYQKAQLQAINTLTKDGSDYLAGIELIYTKTQPIAGMRHLMGPAISYLMAPNEKLKRVMLASLYEDPNATISSVISDLKHSHVKFYVNNYRMVALPEEIKHYLSSEYEHWWGSIYLYAPKIAAGTHIFEVKFSGHYLLEGSEQDSIHLNDKVYPVNQLIPLEKGFYHSEAHHDYRLKLIPSQQALKPNPAFSCDETDRMLF